MSSNNLSIEVRSLDNSGEILSNKETQTSTAYITDSFTLVKGPSRPLPKGINKSNVEVKVDNLLDCKVIKDPSDSRQIILTESFVKDIANVSTSEGSESPRQTYCREVVTPYLKPHLNDCEDNIDSLEKIIQDALEDFPDFQPCNEVYEGKKDIQEKITGRSLKIKKMDTTPKTESKKDTSIRNNIPSDKTSDNKSEEQSTPLLSSRSSSSKVDEKNSKPAYTDNVQLPTVVAEETVAVKPERSISSESLAKCVKESLTALKRSASSCIEKIEIVIGIKKPEKPGEKPTYYAIEKPKVECNASHNVQTETSNSLKSIKNLLNNHSEKIITIKETVKDLAGKFYKNSKDAVTLITSESAKLLSKDKEKSIENINDNNPEKKQRMLRNISADSIASFFFKKAENKPIIKDLPNSEEPDSSVNNSPPAIGPGNLISKIAEDIVNKRIDKSSPYDKPLPKEVSNKLPVPVESRMPTVSAIDHTPDPPSASNMFKIIKSKIFSLFGEEEKPEEINESNQDDDDEYPFERFMEQ